MPNPRIIAHAERISQLKVSLHQALAAQARWLIGGLLAVSVGFLVLDPPRFNPAPTNLTQPAPEQLNPATPPVSPSGSGEKALNLRPAHQPSELLVLPDAEPAQHWAVAEPPMLSSAESEYNTQEVLIGEPMNVDAHDAAAPSALPEDQRDIGEPLDADNPLQLHAVDASTAVRNIGKPRDVELDDGLWPSERNPEPSVRNIGEPMFAPN